MNANEQQREIDRMEREELWLQIQAINIRARLVATSLLLRMAHEEHNRALRPDTTQEGAK